MNIKRSAATVAVLAAAGVAIPAASASAATPRISGHAQLASSIHAAAAAELAGGYTFVPGPIVNGMPPALEFSPVSVAPIQVAPIQAFH